MNPVKIYDYQKFSETQPAIAQAIEELFPELHGAASFELSPKQLTQLPAHMVEQMVDPRATKAKREAAIARLETFWEKEKGLLNNQHNADALAEGLRVLNQGFTAASVDRAIVVLRDQGRLQWKTSQKPAPAPPAAPAAPAQANPAPPEPRRLGNGELELPLNADEFTMRRASKAQLLDLSARRKEGRQRPAGWVG